MKIDLAELASSEGFHKAMKDVPLPLLISVVVLAVNLICYLFVIPDLEAAVAANEGKISALNGEATSLDGKMAEQRKNLSQLPSYLQDYHQLSKSGAFDPEDRLKANDILNGLKDEQKIFGYSLAIAPQETMTFSAKGKSASWPASLITLQGNANYDRPMFTYVDKSLQVLHGRTLLKGLKFERTFKNPLTETEYDKIKKGEAFSLFSFDADMLWVTYPPETGANGGAKKP
jgi:hypothetical protein